MRAAVHRVDVVGEAEHRIAVGVVVLQPDFHGERAAVRHFAVAFEVNRLVVQHALALVQKLDELGDAAFEVERFHAGRLLPLVGQDDAQAFVQERELAQALG